MRIHHCARFLSSRVLFIFGVRDSVKNIVYITCVCPLRTLFISFVFSQKMNFDPNHAKWNCCCCHLASGLRILAGIESFVSLIAVILLIVSLAINRPFAIVSTLLGCTLILTCFLIIGANALLCYGIARNRERYMYPNLAMRAFCVFLVQVLGVSSVIQPSLARHQQPTDDGDVPPVTPLVILVFVMIFVSIAILYTIYLVVHCIRYVHGARRLEERRASITLAPHLIGIS